jgi:hypothetical protein
VPVVYEKLFVWLTWFNVVFQCLGVGDTALTLAAHGGHKALAEMLVVKGADINHADGRGMSIPVHSDILTVCKELMS